MAYWKNTKRHAGSVIITQAIADASFDTCLYFYAKIMELRRSAGLLPHAFAVLALILAFTSGALAEDVTIGIRFVVSDDLGQSATPHQATQAKLESYVAELNDYYRNSEVGLRVEIVDVEFSRIEAVDIMQILDDMAHEQNGFDAMFKKADEFGADYTVAMPSKLIMQGKPGCGRAYAVNQSVEAISSTRKAFAVVNFVCGAHTLAHELGHLMGLNHGTLVDFCHPKMGHTSAITPYANGYAEGNCDGRPQLGEFGDIMVGGHMREIIGNDKGSLPIFSNPRIHDERCGINRTCGDVAIGDAARTLNENAPYYAAHEEPDVHTLDYDSAELLACISKNYQDKEITELEELVCPNADISNVADLEKLRALRHIDLSGNQLEDVGLLGQLPPERIERIDLRGNDRLSCPSLDDLVRRFPGKVVSPIRCSASQ
ncbi:MAG: zinc-dependent metalloprotease family protein [Methylobacter sp.]|uniref:Zinc-dependent metalloprotease family protein n=1 Tax=Candidatus Methylobacter titanis TaxID=3053457 RepID=A0AA43Q6C8_9GAMM|nr:zinc-dependent metalloprotease family protein [Candidatus Methylobacter titanis]